jgi:hypothetical protein
MNGLSLTRNRMVLQILLVIGPFLIGAILWMVSNRIYANHRQGTHLLKQSYQDREQLKGLGNDLEDFLWRRFRVKVSHGISEEALEGIMGMVGKNLTVSDSRPDKFKPAQPQPDFDKKP